MKPLFFYVDSTNPYNSIFLQTKLLANAIERALGVKPVFLNKEELPLYWGKTNCMIGIPFGSLSLELINKTDYSNIILIYHNITPAKFFWTTEPLVSIKSILGRLQLRLLKLRIKNIVSVSRFNQIELEKIGYNDVQLCPNILIKKESIKYIKTSNPSVLYVGRIVQNKDCIKLLKSVIEASSIMTQNLDFFIVGGGKNSSIYYHRFKQLVTKAQLLSNLNIHWVRNISNEELTELYQKSWLYITMSKHEGFGLPVCESINNGTAAIYTACGGQELVLNNLGLVKHETMSFEIKKLLENENLRNQLYLQQRGVINQYMEPCLDKVVRDVYGRFL